MITHRHPFLPDAGCERGFGGKTGLPATPHCRWNGYADLTVVARSKSKLSRQAPLIHQRRIIDPPAASPPPFPPGSQVT